MGHALVERGHRVLFAPAYQLVQRLLAAKLETARATRAAFAALHEILSAEQRQTVDELLRTHGALMPPGMMQAGMMQGGMMQGGMMQGGMMQGGQAPAPQNMQ